ncbi:putative HTH-type transcriptional regulator YdfH [Pelagimonas phthalicica]|uniref:Putative HTH-type transcriptional regulator YdfH n=1 Tax=Pelagimonas phthalicica TaxID=1037362 RepID=A0A238JEL0_9RHOB|nr:GntR family transcriptional regulator [Pelagimonas phthalicica]TDS92019.1 GntR family transcriptional regulator [Pelagimonas phthalicica]SMX29069.1 putative HTH-type transcriptional regulator YdfH [Pelagimonas phthalicica]
MAEENRFEHIANHLRRAILRGDLPPGAPIKERDNAAEMGVSRTPMREAIRQLANEGLVTLRPARSPIVADPPWSEVADCVDVLRTLELLSGDQACARASAEEIEDIAAIQVKMEAQAAEIDQVTLFELDMEFHIAIVNASHNSTLIDTHRALLARLWRSRYLGSREGRNQARVFRQHNDIVAALRDRDAERLQEEIGQHLAILKQQMHHYFHQNSTELNKA